ncbi:hypothetical protein K469DRAFT_651397 [Zopfia rhizophila CBS 207.26]|uniref:Uncharacterized protein n=1 Tax=Zopfia rhizophila CBS 207.26 TaxID=1314779 RepID=A0A6A6EPS4_9PEZI|nr:hypothetical protein K469DRAFT_651397 [Zopfia rhizophila CBS 207.26]
MTQQYGALAENIALLAILDPKLEPVTQNPVPSKFRDGADAYYRALSLKHEQRTAEAFAVLLANTDDPSRIGAICIEEKARGSGLIVRTAVNSGSQAERKATFERIAKALLSAATAGQLNAQEDTLVNEIIAACQPRLLSRLRSRHSLPSRKSCRPPIIPRLRAAVNILNGMQNRPKALGLLRMRVTLLMEAFAKLEALRTADAHSELGRDILKDILLSIELMLASTDLESILGAIPRNVPSWSGLACENLVESFKKLAQYRPAAQYLLHATRKYPIFRNLDIQEVCNGQFPETSRGAEPSSGEMGILTRSLATSTRKRRNQFERMLQARLGRTLTEIRRDVLKHVQRDKRVHAEIQLLFHYEQNEEITLQPRVICSSKYACFLCNLFIKSHGGFYISGSHGRFYPRWRIPRFEELSLSEKSRGGVLQSLNKFNEALEDKIRAYIVQPQIAFPDPNESMVFIPGSYTPSVVSVAQVVESGGAGEHAGNTEALDRTLVDPQPFTRSTYDLELSKLEASPRATIEDIRVAPSTVPHPPYLEIGMASRIAGETSASLDAPASSVYLSNVLTTEDKSPQSNLSGIRRGFHKQVYTLLRGLPTYFCICPGSSARFHTPRIHLELNYERAYSLASGTSSTSTQVSNIHSSNVDVTLRVEWVNVGNVISFKASEQTIELGVPWTHKRVPDGTLFGEHGLVLQKRDNIITLRASLQRRPSDDG